ncbi:MAG: class I SAM-dependent methyltransferase [Candidatus Diapherotrites archaeon]
MERVEFALKNLNGKILDIGYSVGGIHQKFIEKFGKENIFGIDIETKKNTPNYKNASAEKIPFEENEFDSVFAGELIEHLEKPELFLKETNRVLRKNGSLVLTTPNRKSLVNRIFKSYETPIHINLFNYPQLEKLLKKNGLKVEKFFCQPYSDENCYGSRNKWSFLFRKIVHYLLPRSLQEQMIVKAVKTK